MRKTGILTLLLIGAACAAATASPASSSLLTRRSDFDRSTLTAGGGSPVSGLSLSNPGRFSMRQSYSVSAVSSRDGSASSGLYLNTLGYRVSDPLLLFVDVGMHTPLHSSFGGPGATGAAATSLVIPRMGLEYRPSDRWSLNLELVNLPDAWKSGYGSSLFDGSRFP